MEGDVGTEPVLAEDIEPDGERGGWGVAFDTGVW